MNRHFRQMKNAWNFWPVKNGRMDTPAANVATQIIVRAKPPFRGGAQNANQMNQQLHTQFSTVVKSPSPMHLILLIQFVATRMYHPMNYPEKWKSDK